MSKTKTKKAAPKTAKPKVKPGAKVKPKTAAKSKIKVKAKIKTKMKAKPKAKAPAKKTKKVSPAKAKKILKAKRLPVTNTKPKQIKDEIEVPSHVKKYKPNKKTRYTSAELKHFKEIILAERRDILESARANMQSLVDNESGDYVGDNSTYSTHMAEQGTDEMEREKNYMFVQRDEKYLGYLQDALTRIDNGTYGICQDCMEIPKNMCKSCPLIPKERLELVPITQHCIECKNLRG
ncbi:MAG: conjugal transfer protein TraR [Bacteroidetes bacterium]|nr:conjugal transfer protein TraR [Bacteroidota bacterium]